MDDKIGFIYEESHFLLLFFPLLPTVTFLNPSSYDYSS